MSKETIDKVIEKLLGGSYTDGSHHKQYAIMESVKLLLGSKEAVEKQICEDHDCKDLNEFNEEYGAIDWGIDS